MSTTVNLTAPRYLQALLMRPAGMLTNALFDVV